MCYLLFLSVSLFLAWGWMDIWVLYDEVRPACLSDRNGPSTDTPERAVLHYVDGRDCTRAVAGVES
jgi:hypothetical protein